MFTHTLGLITYLCLGSALHAHEVHNLQAKSRVDDEYLVVLNEADTDVDRAKYAEDVTAKLHKISGEFSVFKTLTALRSPILLVKVNNEDTMRKAYQLPEVNVIEANAAHMKAQQCGIQWSTTTYWGLGRIAQRYPDSDTYPYQPMAGAGIRVYILDTGIFTNHSFYLGRAEFGINTIGGDDQDGYGHGTHCAGIAVGDVCGVSRGATAVGVKVLNDSATGTTSSVVEGINWVIENLESTGGRGVISMSMAGDPSDAIDSAVGSATAANIPVVVAAGNNNADACTVSPARAPSAITVGATTRADQLYGGSNWGSCVDILAPGVPILSASTCPLCTTLDYGTSRSSAFVAGAVANYLSYYPSATPAEVKTQLIRNASEGYVDLRGTVGTPNLMLYERCRYL